MGRFDALVSEQKLLRLLVKAIIHKYRTVNCNGDLNIDCKGV